MALRRKLLFALVLFVTVTAPGLADHFLSTSGHDGLGMIVWAGGYGVGIVFIWLVWVRPLDLRGPA